MDVILTSQSLICRYRKAFQIDLEQETEARQQQPQRLPSNQDWQIVLKVAVHKNRSSKRSGYAFEAKTLEGNVLFTGGASSRRKPHQLAIQDAMGEAILKSMELGYNKILIFNNNKRLVQLCNRGRKPS